MEDRRRVIRKKIVTREVGEVGSDLSLAGNPTSIVVRVTRGDEREALIEVLVTGLVGCLAEMKAHDRDRDKYQLRRSLIELRNLVRNNNITAEEVIGELAKRGGVSLDFVVVAHEVEQQQEDELEAIIRDLCPSIPEVRPQGRGHDPHRFMADDDVDEQTGRAHARFVVAESASDLYVTARRPAGMTGGKNIPRDPETGRFIRIV